MDPDRILFDLMSLAKRHPEFGLLQFRTLPSARQYRRLYELMLDFIPRNARVLDWGCGNGHATYALNALGFDVSGYSLDRAPPIARILRNVSFTTSQGLDPRLLPFSNSSFDAVLSVGVLEHVRETGGDELASLRELRRVLKPRGIFICYHFPNRCSYLEALSYLVPGAHRHKYRFTAKAIRTMCASANLDVIAMRRYGALPRNPWQSVNPAIANSRLLADTWDRLDALGELMAPAILQNHSFVARAK